MSVRYSGGIRRAWPSRFPTQVGDQLLFCQRRYQRGASHLVFYLEGRIDEGRLTTAMERLLNVFPILGFRFVEHWWRPYWERCDHVELATLVEVRLTDNLDADLTALVNVNDDPRIAPQVNIVIFRDGHDTLCFRSNHLMFDGAGALQVISVLAEIYNRLSSEPNYQPPMNLADRSTNDIGRSIRLQGKKQMLCNAREAVGKLRAAGAWNSPPTGKGPDHGYFLCHRLGPELVRGLSRYARKERVSLNVLFQATFARAVGRALGHTGNADLPIAVAVNLRTIAKANPDSVANKFGGTLLIVTNPETVELSAVLGQIKEQYKVLRKKLFGAISPALVLETFPVIRTIYRCIPFAWKRRLIHRADARRMGQGAIAITNGETDVRRCHFENATISHIGVIYRFRLHYTPVGLAVVRYGNVITLNCNYMENCVPRKVAEGILEAIECELQACADDIAQRSRYG